MDGNTMDNDKNTNPDQEQELDNALQAAEDIVRFGETERRCLRCGGKLILEDKGSAYTLKCESEDFELIGRGI